MSVNEVPKEIEGNFNQESDSHDGGVPNRVNLQYYSELLQSSSQAMALVSSRQVFEEKNFRVAIACELLYQS